MNDMLTIRNLPILGVKRQATTYKYTLDKNLVEMLHSCIALQFPHVDVGKRFAVEYALMTFLADHKFIKQGPIVPERPNWDFIDYTRIRANELPPEE